jgi:hypothetical protein
MAPGLYVSYAKTAARLPTESQKKDEKKISWIRALAQTVQKLTCQLRGFDRLNPVRDGPEAARE